MFALVPTLLASRSFGVSLKGVRLHHGVEQTVFQHVCTEAEAPCALQHWWSGGTFPGYLETRVRYYIDAEAAPVDMPLGPAHGMAPDAADDNGPWSAGGLFGKSGVGLHGWGGSGGSGFFNTFLVPFGRSVNVTVSLGGPGGGEYFWLVLRGRTKAQLVLPGGMALPPTARLRSYENRPTPLPVYATLALFNSSAANGALLMVSLAVRAPSGSFAFLEGCVRGHDNASAAPWLLSSGTEDYFLGTFYFDKGQYFLPLAGVTSLCPEPSDGNPRPKPVGCDPAPGGGVNFSAYRIHASADPLVFEGGLAVSWRNGEPGHGGGFRPSAINASSFALVYEW